MDARTLLTSPCELRITGADWRRLHQHLFPGDGGEHGAAMLCGVAGGPGRPRLLVREVVLAEDGVDYVIGPRGFNHLTGEFVTEQVHRARHERLVYLAVHNHGGSTSVGFSPIDLGSHERGYPTLMKVARQPVGAMVLAPAAAGEIWLPDHARHQIISTTVVGSKLEVFRSEPDMGDPRIAARYDRQALLYGPAGQAILAGAKVAVVGVGGVGMLLVQLLGRLGVGHLVAIDPERVDVTNLPRLPDATRIDAVELLDRDGVPDLLRKLARRLAAPKVRVAKRIVRRAGGTTVDPVFGDIADDDVARKVLDCDFIFLTADTPLARNVTNQIAYQYLVPTLQVGSKVVVSKRTGDITDVFGVVRTLGTEPGCLWCGGLIDSAGLAEAAVGDERQVARQRYVDDPKVHAPSVITLNAMAAGWAANDFMQYMVGLGRPAGGFRILRINPTRADRPHVVVQELDSEPSCPVCGSPPGSARALGDLRELPTRIRM